MFNISPKNLESIINGLAHYLIVARNVLNPDEIKYFVSNMVPIAGGILNVILDYVFIGLFGFVGVFWVTLIVHSMTIFVISVYFYMKVNATEPLNQQ